MCESVILSLIQLIIKQQKDTKVAYFIYVACVPCDESPTPPPSFTSIEFLLHSCC
ncbi:hypothetical protein AsAng_0055050 [Aureispira anguillae]|uniref:Uncharacterized protein n=1 Tax=Aureispira anguillae TaxID=2864201 RepID=A0A916DV39_9BACT|nr:hypothetical protein AsAng_0055050 [Aureispira anguillae]